MSTEKALGPLLGVSGGGEGDEGAGENVCDMEVIGRGVFVADGLSKHALMC